MKTNGLVIVGVLLAAVFAAAADGKPTLSQSPMTAEQIEVYRAFLTSYTNGGKSPHFNLAKHTSTLDLSEEKGEGGCLKGIDLDCATHPESVIHEFDPKISLRENITLVDTDDQGRVVHENDPSQTMRQGIPVDQAVGRAFAAGLLTLSEVVFDKNHQFAAMRFSFICGGRCGHGATLLFRKRHGEWKELKRDCGGWIS
ncbi:MAG: hypothetical protein ACLPHP_03420 [Candidatus Sulfotelmatobacter sp.]